MGHPFQTTWGLDPPHGCSEDGSEDNNSGSYLQMKPGLPARPAHLLIDRPQKGQSEYPKLRLGFE